MQIPISHLVPINILLGHLQDGILCESTMHSPPFIHFINSHGCNVS